MFFQKLTLATSMALILAACGDTGGNAQAPATNAENTVKNQTATAETAPAPAATPATPAAAPAEPAEQFAALPAPYNTADYAKGRRTFKLCSSCHTLQEGAGDLVGPNLYGLFGRKAGAVESFQYSKAVEESDIVWTPEHVDEWLASPRDYLKGNRMSFSGVRRPADRTAVIAYIMSETGYTAPTE